jgi:glycosyltransferase involved in cell wall biosynthesis
MSNIGIVTTWFPAGAGYVSKAYREILSNEHNVFIYARGGKQMKGDIDWDDKKVYWAPKHYSGIRTNNLLNWAKKNQIDILFFNEQRYWKPVVAAKKTGYCIGAYVDYYTQITVPAFEIYDFLICNTKKHFSVFNWHKNAFYIPWGTDVEKFKPNKISEQRKLTFLLSAGWQGQSIIDRRGTLFALQAFTKVPGDIALKVYSQLNLSSCVPEWQNLVRNDPRIQFIFGTFDPFPFHEGDIYLYPSRLDGIGLTLPEAISSGLAVITTDNAPMNEFVIDGYNGKLIPVEKYLGRTDGYYWAESICSIKSIAEKINYFLENIEIIEKYKNQSRDYATSNLNWTHNAKDLSLIFSNTLKSKYTPSEGLYQLTVKLDKEMSPSIFNRIVTIVDLLKRQIF